MKHYVHLCDRFTERVWKIAYAQQQLGDRVTVVYRQDCHPDLMATIDTVSRWLDPADLPERIGRLYYGENWTLWVHISITESTLPMIAALSTCSRYYLDIHDYTDHAAKAARETYPQLIIAPSKRMADQLSACGKTVCLYSKVPKSYHISPARQLQACSLAAGAEIGGPVWRDYRQVADWLKETLFLFPCFVDDPRLPAWFNVMQRLPYSALLPALSRFRYSWCGAANDKHTIHDCVTNKFWNALAVGSCPILYRSDEMEEIARQIGIGSMWIPGDYDYPLESLVPFEFTRQQDTTMEAELLRYSDVL